MNVIVVDDEKSMLLIMKKMISKIPDINIVGSFQSPSEAYLFIENNKVDIAFVDINMPEESGLDFVRRVKLEIEDIHIVFLTAHKEYALEAFEVHAFDYIIKPILQLKLENSILRMKQRFAPLQPLDVHVVIPKLFVNCLGGMDVRGADNETVQFTSTKSIELLAYLLIKKGRFVSKWSIIEDVFRGMPPHNAETYLNTTVYKLRKALQPHGMRSAIIASNESYKIEMKDIYVDFVDFENRLTSLSDLKNTNQNLILLIEKLFLGELYGEKDYYWSLPEKERLSELYLSFAKNLVRYMLERNQINGALQVAKKLININEFDVEANCLLMKIYANQRNMMLLVRQYENYSKVLRSELGILPENVVINLYSVLIKSFK